MQGRKLGIIYTVFLFLASFLGSRVLKVDLLTALSPIRIGVLLAPFALLVIKNNRLEMLKRPVVLKFLVFWTIYSLLLIVFVRELELYIQYLFYLITALIIAIFGSRYLYKEKDFYTILVCFEIVALLFSAIGLYEIITGNYRFISEDSMNYYETNSAVFSTLGIRVPTGSFSNPNDFGFFLLFAFCVACSLASLSSKKSLKIFYSLTAVFFAFMVTTTQSRAAFVSLLLGVLMLVYLSFKNYSKNTKIIVIVVALMSFSFVFSWIIANKELFGALLEIDIASGTSGDEAVRFNLLRNGLSILVDHYFLGTGLGQIEYHMVQPGMANTDGITNIHNWWAEVLVSSGVIVFFFYISLYIQTFVFFIKKSLSSKVSSKGIIYARTGATMLTVFFIGCMASSSIFCIEWIWAMFIYWMLLPRIIK